MKKPRLSRRDFLRLALVAAIGGGVAFLERITAPAGALTYTRWRLRGMYQQWLAPAAVVALGECASYQEDVLSRLRELWKLAEMPDVRGKRLLVKPNLVDVAGADTTSHPSTTNPLVVAAVIDLLIELGAQEIVVGDGPAFRREAGPIAQSCGLAAVLAARNIPFVDLNYDDPLPVPAQDGWLQRSTELWLPKSVRQADYIVSVPKLKTHHWALVSLSVKNMLGVIPGARYGWPKNMLHINGFIPSILGVYQTLPPVLSVVDGIVGMEGDGPLFGTPVPHGLLAVGHDPLATDVVCADLMGIPLEAIPYLSLARWGGVGQTTHIETRGVAPERLRRQYQRPANLAA